MKLATTDGWEAVVIITVNIKRSKTKIENDYVFNRIFSLVCVNSKTNPVSGVGPLDPIPLAGMDPAPLPPSVKILIIWTLTDLGMY